MKTASQIFKANQILTLAIAKTLIGKTISVTNSEYRANSCHVRTGKLISIESEWDLAGKQDHSHLDGGKYATRQDYWKSYMGELQIAEMKRTFRLVSDSELFAKCDTKSFFYKEPTFFGSDEDREIYYVIED